GVPVVHSGLVSDREPAPGSHYHGWGRSHPVPGCNDSRDYADAGCGQRRRQARGYLKGWHLPGFVHLLDADLHTHEHLERRLRRCPAAPVAAITYHLPQLRVGSDFAAMPEGLDLAGHRVGTDRGHKLLPGNAQTGPP